jgi:uncharacterized protein
VGDPRAIIADLDGTLFLNNRPRAEVIDYVNAFDGVVLVVTARLEDERDRVTELLSGVVRVEKLIMRDEDEPQEVYKRRVGEAMLRVWDVVEAVENDSASRAAYADLGITTIDPDSLGADRSRGFGIGSLLPMTPKVEQRFVDVAEIEVRDGVTGDGMSFAGYAAVFDTDSEPLPFIERIKPGAFTRSLKSRNEIKMFVNHDMGRVLASRRAGTMRLAEDDRGLRVEADLPDTTDGRDLSVLMQRGDVNSMSFGFSVPKGGDRWSADGQTRELLNVRLHEASVVTGWPAYAKTTAAVRSLDALSEKTGLDAVRMNDAITKLENGEELSPDDAAMLDEAISKLRSEPAPVEVEPVANLLSIKQHKLELLKVA